MYISLLSFTFLFYFSLSFVHRVPYFENSLLETMFWYAIIFQVEREFFIIIGMPFLFKFFFFLAEDCLAFLKQDRLN